LIAENEFTGRDRVLRTIALAGLTEAGHERLRNRVAEAEVLFHTVGTRVAQEDCVERIAYQGNTVVQRTLVELSNEAAHFRFAAGENHEL
jgi:hypothetical protein